MLGDDYLSLLPEAVPFVAELMEGECERELDIVAVQESQQPSVMEETKESLLRLTCARKREQLNTWTNAGHCSAGSVLCSVCWQTSSPPCTTLRNLSSSSS